MRQMRRLRRPTLKELKTIFDLASQMVGGLGWQGVDHTDVPVHYLGDRKFDDPEEMRRRIREIYLILRGRERSAFFDMKHCE